MFMPEQVIGPYVLVSCMGRGGFGEVWLAERRTKFVTTRVALKLPLDPNIDPTAIRNEAQNWAQASGHPNVLAIIEAEEYDGHTVIVSEFAPDGSLHDLLKKCGGSLAVGRALELCVGILAGLEFLHSRSIIHRDLKPANVLLQGDTPRLVDFGLSRMLRGDSASLTSAGTPHYMAPEALDRKRNVQTDLWSVGVILYEMLSGRFPFQTENLSDLMVAILTREPDPLPDHVPVNVRQIVSKALSKDLSVRYTSASDFRTDLVRATRGAVMTDGSEAVTLPAAGLKSVDRPPTSNRRSVAILPFKNLAGDPMSHFYEFSLADAVTTDLARIRSLLVRPSSTIARFQGNDVDPLDAGRQMGVSSVLSASFVASATRLRVTAQLLDVMTGDILWSDRIDADTADILTLQDAIARHIVAGLDLRLSSNEQNLLVARPTEVGEAYEEYLRGRDRLARFLFRTLSKKDIEAAINSFERATELDPNFGKAWSYLGVCFANRVFKGISDGSDYERAENAFDRALELDPRDIEARSIGCFIDLAQGEKKKARAEIAQLHEEYPENPGVQFCRAVICRLDGDYTRALECWNRLERIDPASAIVATWNRARLYSFQGDNEKAIREIAAAEEIEPGHPLVAVVRSLILFHAGDFEGALRAIRQAIALHPHLEGMRPLLALCLAASGQSAAALEALTKQALRAADADHDIAYWTAATYSRIGDDDESLKWLERSVKLGFEDWSWIRSDPSFANLREHPRFQSLTARLNST
jgi:serine/threonine-protein kinase